MPLRWPPIWWPWQPPTPTPVPPAPPPIPVPPPSTTSQQLLAAHNATRLQNGKGPIRVNPILQAMAQSHADAMAKSNKLSHDWASDGSYSSRLTSSGYRYSNAGENVAWDQLTVQQVMTAWLNSPPHRQNILGNFAEGGFAVSYATDNTPYWCTEFGMPAASAMPPAPPKSTPPFPKLLKATHGYLVPPVTVA